MAIAGWMVYSVICFMKGCILYNKPSEMVEEIEKRYKEEKKRASEKDNKQSSKIKSKESKSKSELEKKIWIFFGSFNKRTYLNNADYEYIDRLTEVCRYAFQKNDYNIYLSVWSKINDIIKDEKTHIDADSDSIAEAKPKYLSARFLDAAFLYYTKSADNNRIQDSLITTRLTSYSHDKYPSMVDLFWLMRVLLKMAGRGELQFIEKYFLDCKYSYRFVLYLPQVLYVQDGNVGKRPEVEKKSWERWEEICDYHFILAAYAFNQGLKSLPKQILSEDSGLDILPHNKQELLIRYARCKSKMRSNGGFDFSDPEDLYGRRVDPEYVDQFAALMFALLDDETNCYYYMYSSEDILKTLNESSENFIKIGNKLKKESYVILSYNNVCQYDYNGNYSESIKLIKNKPTKEVFEIDIPKKTKDAIELQFLNQINQIENLTCDEMWGEDSTEKIDELEFKACPIRINKDALLALDINNYFCGFRNVMEIIESRAIFLYLKSISKMLIDEVTLTISKFDAFIRKRTNNKPKEYVLIDFDSPFIAILPIKHKTFREAYYGDTSYIIIRNYTYLRDTQMYKQWDGKLVLMKKTDLPALVKVNSTNDVSVNFEDQSNYDKGTLEVRILIDTNRKVKYNKKAQVVKIDLARVRL
ncbi:MAG: hypothetical protein WCR36_06415 [Bacteroidaceae bacterium]